MMLKVILQRVSLVFLSFSDFLMGVNASQIQIARYASYTRYKAERNITQNLFFQIIKHIFAKASKIAASSLSYMGIELLKYYV